MKVQDRVVEKAKQSAQDGIKGNSQMNVREADKFAARLQREINFLRYSK